MGGVGEKMGRKWGENHGKSQENGTCPRLSHHFGWKKIGKMSLFWPGNVGNVGNDIILAGKLIDKT